MGERSGVEMVVGGGNGGEDYWMKGLNSVSGKVLFYFLEIREMIERESYRFFQGGGVSILIRNLLK